jgi:hypothetical protein
MFASIPNDLAWAEDTLPLPLSMLKEESAAFWRWLSQATLAKRAKEQR